MEHGRIIWWHEVPRVEDFAGGFTAGAEAWVKPEQGNSNLICIPYDSIVPIVESDNDTVTITFNGATHILNRMLVDVEPTAKPGDLIHFRSPVIMLEAPILKPEEYDFRWVYTNRLRLGIEKEIFLVVKELAGWLMLNTGAWVTKSCAWVSENP